MRSSVFVSALFVGTLLAGTAAAERNDSDETRPRAAERHRAPTDKQQRVERNTDRAERKVETSHRYQSKSNVPTAKESRVSKLQMALRLPKQAQERMRCETGSEDCTSSTSDRKSVSSNADRGVRKVEASKTTSDKNRAAAPSAAARAVLQKILSAKCSAAARGGCTGDGSDPQ
ncbi:MAG: hypothetical protein WKG00_02330 [Polyangiaceae bacterium]